MNTAVAGTLQDGTSAQTLVRNSAATIESLLKSLKAGESIVTHGRSLVWKSRR